MTAYILTDTDHESPSIHEVLNGPAGIDIGDLNSRYTKAGIKLPFVAWLCRYHGFSRIDYEVCEVVNFEKPVRYRGTR